MLALGGTVRPQSTTEAALRYCLKVLRDVGVETELLGGQDLLLPVYDPANPGRDPRARRLLAAVRRADAVILATPAYHACVSGLVKNALDYLEELRAEDPPYLAGRAVGCIVTSRGPQAGGTTLTALRSIVHALRGWPTPLGVVINTAMPVFDETGEPLDPVVRRLDILTREVLAGATFRTRCRG
ncbi:MAG TPA: NAD(P)H-dependent oxidoreductase [Micromonosporaceae bacterium]